MHYACRLIIMFAMSTRVAIAMMDYAPPDFTLEDEWEKYIVQLVEVREARADNVVVGVRENFSNNDANEKEATFEKMQMHDLYSPEIGKAATLDGLKSKDLLLVYRQTSRPKLILFERVREDHDSKRLQQLRRIVQLRGAPRNIEVMLENSLDEDEVVSLYCLKRLLDEKLPSGSRGKIIKARDDEARPVRVRLSCNELLNKIDGVDSNSDKCFNWFKEQVAGSKNTDTAQLSVFLTQMLAIEAWRQETPFVILAFALDASARVEIRSAAILQLSDWRIFSYGDPTNNVSTHVFETLATLLKRESGVVSVKFRTFADGSLSSPGRPARAGSFLIVNEERTAVKVFSFGLRRPSSPAAFLRKKKLSRGP